MWFTSRCTYWTRKWNFYRDQRSLLLARRGVGVRSTPPGTRYAVSGRSSLVLSEFNKQRAKEQLQSFEAR